MILTITPNPALDRMYFIDRFDFDVAHRVSRYTVDAGGKGINVTKVLRQLGRNVRAGGFLGGREGGYIESRLSSLGVETAFEWVQHASRTTISIADASGQTFELVEPGPAIDAKRLEAFYAGLPTLLQGVEVVVLSGSLAEALPTTFYRTCVDQAKRAGAKVILDSSGEPLREGLKGGPDLIKPNQKELEGLLGRTLDTVDEIADAALETLAMGAEAAAVSLGEAGMVYIERERAWRLEVPSIRAVNPVGSGDSVAAGLAAGLEARLELTDMLRRANACGVSNAGREAIGDVDPDAIEAYAQRIRIREL